MGAAGQIGARLHVSGGQRYVATDHVVEGDWSQAAFWLVAGALGHRVSIDGLTTDSLQGDRAVVAFLQQMGAEVRADGTRLRVTTPTLLRGIDMDVSQCPDLVPALAIAAARAHGVSRIGNAARLRFKECDRLAAVRDMLEVLGIAVSETPDGLVITGRPEGFGAGIVEGCNDHRIVMAAAVAATQATGAVRITWREAVRKSYPDFWEDFAAVGGNGREDT
jgi:3-phosphoshikimate 1-carboxyvinyltransferase